MQPLKRELEPELRYHANSNATFGSSGDKRCIRSRSPQYYLPFVGRFRVINTIYTHLISN